MMTWRGGPSVIGPLGRAVGPVPHLTFILQNFLKKISKNICQKKNLSKKKPVAQTLWMIVLPFFLLLHHPTQFFPPKIAMKWATNWLKNKIIQSTVHRIFRVSCWRLLDRLWNMEEHQWPPSLRIQKSLDGNRTKISARTSSSDHAATPISSGWCGRPWSASQCSSPPGWRGRYRLVSACCQSQTSSSLYQGSAASHSWPGSQLPMHRPCAEASSS